MEPEQVQRKNSERDHIESTLLGIQELKNNLVTQIAHNFRTPLASVIGFAEILVDEQPLTDEQRVEYARFIQYEGIRLSKLIDDLIELSSLERESIPLSVRLCVLQDVVAEAVGKVAGFARGRYVTVRIDAPVEPVRALLHCGKIAQAVYQLLHNAIRVSKSQCEVRVEIREADGVVEIAVHDDGPGVDDAEIPALVERFGKSYKPELDPFGTGVGLAIVRHIVDLHRGRIRVESKPGEGSTFTIQFRSHQQ
ncbi:MAG TPA: HAMP domain-containing sensor histidine kinase [Bacteroidota bacterium]|nr:HAMP domain-containing sensor histidine kinase [Bacteroidota bacterium]